MRCAEVPLPVVAAEDESRSSAGHAPSAAGSGHLGVVLALVALAALVRGYAWRHTTALFNDGPIFLYIARAMGEGEWSAVLRHPFHPLYSAMVAAMGWLVGDLERGAVLVSIATGSAAVGMLYLFLRDAFGEGEAVIGAAILALHPYAVDFSCDVQSEGLYIFLFLAAVWLLWRALGRAEALWAGLAGLAVGLAYLTRPEALLLCLVAAGFGVERLLRRQWSLAAAVCWIAAFAAGVGIVLAPYVGAIRAETGRWALTQKHSVAQVAGLATGGEARSPAWALDRSAAPPQRGDGHGSGPSSASPALRPIPVVEVAPHLGDEGEEQQEPVSALGIGLRAANELWRAAASVITFPILFLVLVGIGASRRSFGLRDGFVAAITGVYMVALYALALGAGYVSRRHGLPPLLPALGYAALAVPIVGGFLLELLRRWRPAAASPGGNERRNAAILGFAIILLFLVPRDLRERRSERLAERRAAEWLREQPHAEGPVAAGRLRAAYYAGAAHVPLPSGQGSDILMYLQIRRARYLIIDEAEFDERGGLRDAVGQELRLLHRSEAAGRSVGVYSVADGQAP
jgi:4-amino-4-deoxy-L-arabinose transferase-like glycosyltransferase